MMTMGEKIRERRIACGLTQAELAGDTLTRNMISELESGKTSPSLKTLLYLSEQLKTSPLYFLDPKYTKEQELTERYYPQVIKLFCEGKYDEMISISEEYLSSSPDDLLAFLLASAHLSLAEKCANGGSFHTAKEHLEKMEKYRVATKIDTAHLTARALLCRASVEDPLTPKFVLDSDGYLAAVSAATDTELFHYLADDWDYPYTSKIYGNHMQAKRMMKEYRYAEAITAMDAVLDDKQSKEMSVLVLFRIYADMEICYKERKDYENAYRFAAKKNTLMTSFRN